MLALLSVRMAVRMAVWSLVCRQSDISVSGDLVVWLAVGTIEGVSVEGELTAVDRVAG